jgi:hypothetical protein
MRLLHIYEKSLIEMISCYLLIVNQTHEPGRGNPKPELAR